MLDKTILVFYINIPDNASYEESNETIKRVQDLITPSKEDKDKMIQYVIPVRNQETRIECINSSIYINSEENEKKFLDKIKKMDDKLDRITSSINAESERRNVLSEKFINYIL